MNLLLASEQFHVFPGKFVSSRTTFRTRTVSISCVLYSLRADNEIQSKKNVFLCQEKFLREEKGMTVFCKRKYL